MTELKIVKGPNKGKLVILVGKYDESKILVQDYSNNMIYPISKSFVKEVQYKKLVSVKKVDTPKKIESESYIQQPVKNPIVSDEYVEYTEENLDLPDITSDLYKVGYENLGHNELDSNVDLKPLEKKFYLFIKSFFGLLYSDSKNIEDIVFLSRKISVIAEKNNIAPSKYKFFTAILFYILIKHKDLRIPDTFIVKFNRDFFLQYIKEHLDLKINNGSIQEFSKIITKELYKSKEKQPEKLKNTIDIINDIEKDTTLTKKQKDILLKTVPLFPEKDFSTNINPLVKKWYLEYLKVNRS